MGNKGIGIVDVLFTRTQARVLGVLFRQPERSFYLTEILDRAQVGSGTVRRELERLTAAGIVNRSRVGNQVHFQANRRSPVFEELHGLVMKTVDAEQALAAVPVASTCRRYAVSRLVLFGSAARGTATSVSDLDFIVEFESGRTPTLAGLAALKDELESLYGRRVDLATPAILNNPHRRKAIEKDMEVIYERKGSRIPVGHARRRA